MNFTPALSFWLSAASGMLSRAHVVALLLVVGTSSAAAEPKGDEMTQQYCFGAMIRCEQAEAMFQSSQRAFEYYRSVPPENAPERELAWGLANSKADQAAGYLGSFRLIEDDMVRRARIDGRLPPACLADCNRRIDVAVRAWRQAMGRHAPRDEAKPQGHRDSVPTVPAMDALCATTARQLVANIEALANDEHVGYRCVLDADHGPKKLTGVGCEPLPGRDDDLAILYFDIGIYNSDGVTFYCVDAVTTQQGQEGRALWKRRNLPLAELTAVAKEKARNAGPDRVIPQPDCALVPDKPSCRLGREQGSGSPPP